MSKALVLDRDFFEENINEILEFSKRAEINTEIEEVRGKKSGGKRVLDMILKGDFSSAHKVTGDEFNERIVAIVEHFNDLFKTQTETIKQFGNVYNAFNTLDEEYVGAISKSFKGLKESNDQIEATQKTLKKSIEDQKKTLEILYKFKQRLDGYAHLDDLDRLWDDCQVLSNDISAISVSVSEAASANAENANAIDRIKTSLKEADSEIVRLSETAKEQKERTETLFAFMNELKSLTHLREIDAVWDKAEENGKKLTALAKESADTAGIAEKNRVAVAELTDYKKELSAIAHLKDVDELWDDSEQHSVLIEELKNQGEETRAVIGHTAESFDRSLAAERERTDTVFNKINKKIILYFFSLVLFYF